MGITGFMGLGGWEIIILLAVVAAAGVVLAVLFAVVRAAAVSGARRAQRETEPTRTDRQD